MGARDGVSTSARSFSSEGLLPADAAAVAAAGSPIPARVPQPVYSDIP